jgi:hypothetical protein
MAFYENNSGDLYLNAVIRNSESGLSKVAYRIPREKIGIYKTILNISVILSIAALAYNISYVAYYILNDLAFDIFRVISVCSVGFSGLLCLGFGSAFLKVEKVELHGKKNRKNMSQKLLLSCIGVAGNLSFMGSFFIYNERGFSFFFLSMFLVTMVMTILSFSQLKWVSKIEN